MSICGERGGGRDSKELTKVWGDEREERKGQAARTEEREGDVRGI